MSSYESGRSSRGVQFVNADMLAKLIDPDASKQVSCERTHLAAWVSYGRV
jgi:hypothetical protein